MKWEYAEFEIRNAAQAEGASHDVSFPLPHSSFHLPVLRFHRRTRAIVRPDLTAAIGVGCLAIFLFLLALSFAADQNRLAGPPDVVPAMLRITSAGQVLLGGETIEMASLPAALTRHNPALRGNRPERATLILCADGGAAAGVVRRVIKICQDAGFQASFFATRPVARDRGEPMRFRQHVEPERIPASLIPMLGVAMLLWIACLFSLRGTGPGADLQPQSQLTPAAEQAGQGRSLPLHVRLRASGDGRLAGIVVEEQPLASLTELQQHLRQAMAGHREADATAAFEVELAFDDQLQYQYLMDAMTAIARCPSSDGRGTVKLIDDIKFAAP